MNDATSLPLALYKTNLQLQAGLARLVRHNARHWLGFGERLAEAAADDGDTMAADLLKSEDWQALASLPAEALWRQLERRCSDGQALMQTALDAQSDFARGLQEVLQSWQKGTSEALGSGIQGLPFDGSAWNDLMKFWQNGAPTGAIAHTDRPATGKDKRT